MPGMTGMKQTISHRNKILNLKICKLHGQFILYVLIWKINSTLLPIESFLDTKLSNEKKNYVYSSVQTTYCETNVLKHTYDKSGLSE